MQAIFSAPLPWQQAPWQQLWQSAQHQRLAHAFLLSGPPGLGKTLFAEQFAQALLCTQKTAEVSIACQDCHSCRLFRAQTHPDYLVVTPEKSGKTIKIEQIRTAIDRLNQTTLSSKQILILYPAEKLLNAAANALLKSLEEPSPNTFFLLLSEKPGLLLPTIRSRCQHIRFYAPSPQVGQAWLKKQWPSEIDYLDERGRLADHAPLQVLHHFKTGFFTQYQALVADLVALIRQEQDPIQLVERYLKKEEWVELPTQLMHITQRILSQQLGFYRADLPVEPNFVYLANHCQPHFLLCYFEQLLDRQHHQAISLNQQLMLEDLFLAWIQQDAYVSRFTLPS